MDNLRAKFITWHEKHFNAFWPGNPTHEERWVTWQAATEAAKATGTAGDAITMSRDDLVSYRNAAFNEGIAEGLDRAARQPAPVVAVKTWKQCLEDLDANIGDGIDMDHPIIKAMKAEISDLRAALAATNRSQP